MFTSGNSVFFNFSTIIAILFLLIDHYCFCINPQSFNSSIDNGFSQAVATWYGSPTGSGSAGGACGFENDVANPPYNGMITAGNQVLYKHGKGCGNCYQVKCTDNPSCSGNAITVVLTDECPGTCNDDPVHFDLSGKAFGFLAKRGQDDNLRKAGRINIQYQSVPCHYNVAITFKIDGGSNRYYLAFTIEYVDGDGDIGSVEISSSNSKGWLTMQQSWGATWKVGLPEGISGPYSVKIITIESKKVLYKSNVIPANWAPGKYYS
ncbi:putative expansin-b14 [Phtheirospermum japonicum]|uniref:Putative expansin-b14 n=1 Tax=Phtheirospermum japonicum TaxID=374723 RepID=A0A830D581_9LAMI|nr:putative expansin-b14 [Phtheirospermum japonicum]